MRRLATLGLVAAAAALGLVPSEAPAAAPPTLHAHRGGALSQGVPDQYEDTLEAMQRRIAQTPGVWLEMDAGVSSDGVPFVIHDSTLDRTTDCTGALLDRTAAQIGQCRVDVLGVASDRPATQVPAPASPVVRVPRLATVLAAAKAADAPVNLEIERIPGDPGYVPGDTAFATRVMDVVKAARLDPAKLIIQSFDPTNLDVAKAALPGVATSYLATGTDPSGVLLCMTRGYDHFSPGGVPAGSTVTLAHTLGIGVIASTLDTAADVQAATAAGVDALITDDVPLARQALGLPPLPLGPTGTGGPSGPSGATGVTGLVQAATGLTGPTGPAITAPTPVTIPKGRATLRLVDRTRAIVLLRRKLTVSLTGRAGAQARVRITARGRLLASGEVTLRVSGRTIHPLRLRPRGRRLLARRRGPLRVTVRSMVDGEPAVTRRTLR